MHTEWTPSQKASTDTSSPVMNSSTTISAPASPNTRSTMISRAAAIASSVVSGNTTPLPAANPDAWSKSGELLSRKLYYIFSP